MLFDTTVFGNVAVGLKLRRLSRREIRDRVDACLTRFRIAHLADRSARKLSSGEAQRTSLARAFATNPETDSSARNVFPCSVSKVVQMGLYTKVFLDCGFSLVAAITNQSLESLSLRPGCRIFASFKATAVHVFRKG